MKSILVVDNNPVLLQLMTTLLTKEGHRVKTARDGLHALDVLAEYQPDVIFVDLVMPNIDGKTLCQVLRTDEKYKNTYLAILSAISAEEWVDIRQIGADACIAKGPFTEMAEYVRYVLEKPQKAAVRCMGGEVLGINRVFPRGITAELLSVKRHYEVILDKMSEGIIEINADNRIIYANPAALCLVERSPGALLGMSFDKLFQGADRDRVGALIQGGVKNPVFIGEEAPATLHRSLITMKIQPLGEREKSALVIFQDVTKRKKTEEELKRHRTRLEEIVEERTRALGENEQRYRLLFKHAPAGIFEVDLKDSSVIRVNDVMCRYTGYDEQQLLRLRLDDLLDLDARVLWHRQAEAAIREKTDPEPMELAIRGREGRSFQALATSGFHRLDTAEGRATIVIHDLTELKKAEEEKKRLEMQLHRAQKLEALGTLAAGIAHDFNNLLMGIQGSTSLLLMDMDERHPQFEKLKNIERSVRRGEALTQRALGLVRPGRSRTMPTNINEVIDTSSKMFGRAKKEIRIHKKYEESAWNVNVDPNQIDQVLLNLFVNAWQAMSGGGNLYIETRNVVLAENFAQAHGALPGRYVNISVSDDGAGMDRQTLEKIFDPFFTTKEAGQGTGLGMAISYGIVKNHGGIIEVQSTPGEGSTFDLYLPASAPRFEAAPEPPAPLPTGTETILLVDDEELVREVERAVLERLGYSVVCAASGQEAENIYRESGKKIDMVILDMIMPGMGGGETFDRLHALDPDLPVLLASGYSEQGRAEEILRRGCRGFLQKPFTPDALSRKVREVLDSPSPAPAG